MADSEAWPPGAECVISYGAAILMTPLNTTNDAKKAEFGRME